MVAIVDDGMFDDLNRFKWYAAKNGRNFYACRHVRLGKKEKQVRIQMHQMILNPGPGLETDHIDGDGLNNQMLNLRVATRSQNGCNRRTQRGTSKYKGVHWHKSSNKWMTRVMKDGERLFLGLFLNEIDAALSYDAAARKFHGEFARTNF